MSIPIDPAILTYFSVPGKMTLLDEKYLPMVKQLPDDVKDLSQIIQGLVIHEFVALDYYGVEVLDEREHEPNLRQANQLLEGILTLNNLPLISKREPKDRLVGVCHHFAKILTTFLRAKGIPCRMRYGFGDYFNPGYFEDHIVCEYWNALERRWMLVDTQFDEIWQQRLHITHDIFDVPRNRFLTAGVAWEKCQTGEIDPSTVGIFQGDLRGLWFVAGDIIKDIAALNKVEMLPWDAWTGMPRPNNQMKNPKTLHRFDQLAALTNTPDKAFESLQKLFSDPDNRIWVPDRVFNARRRHLERI